MGGEILELVSVEEKACWREVFAVSTDEPRTPWGFLVISLAFELVVRWERVDLRVGRVVVVISVSTSPMPSSWEEASRSTIGKEDDLVQLAMLLSFARVPNVRFGRQLIEEFDAFSLFWP